MNDYNKKRSADQTGRSPNPNVFNQDSHPKKWSIKALLDAQFPDPNWVVEGLLPEGLSALGGRPKVGKSFLALQLARSKALGEPFLGIPTTPGAVLYLALEDSPRRMQDRLRIHGVPPDADITIVFRWDNYHKVGHEALIEVVKSGEYDLIIVDTISRLLGNLDQLDMGEMNPFFGELQSAAIETGLALLLIDHHRKIDGRNHDPIEDLLGSTGKSAPLDTAIGLYKNQGKHTASLMFVGREIGNQDIELEWQVNTLSWRSVRDVSGVREGSFNAKVKGTISELTENGDYATTRKIADRLAADESQVNRALADLCKLGVIRKDEKKGSEQPYSLCEK